MCEQKNEAYSLELPRRLKKLGRIRAAVLGKPFSQYLRELIANDVAESRVEELLDRGDETEVKS